MSKVIHQLKQILADTYALYLKTQNYHWNVHGPDFYQLHLLLEMHYEEMAKAIDEIAEHIRTLGSSIHADFESFAKLTTIHAGDPSFNAQHMLSDLSKSHEIVCRALSEGIKAAQASHDDGTEDLLVERLRWHKKAIWILVSHLQ